MNKPALAALLTVMAVSTGPNLPASAEEMKPMKSMDSKAMKQPSPAQAAMRERMKTCGAEWKEMKASGKAEAGMSWRKYWSACNARLKDMKA